jgi:hypothetical protein
VAKREEELYNVTVLSRREGSEYPKVGQEVKVIYVTYVAAGLAPATIKIEKDKYSLDAEKRLIKEAIVRRLKEKPESYKV